ncbi:SDR family oxidoreductase [Acidisoma cellulosilytica]|uniref:SDR family oxidoreductase n=1 Tax=Acidisoma cellulosilyticum TaxID=2802395 RepID=A0A963Z3N9_9PROT|nr:SDR family oxidoreductase [Acidisoma cellulosilyticum]MCB8882229.1 SDR family oxidoreductase [Acidisoma cellulosilyticum]
MTGPDPLLLPFRADGKVALITGGAQGIGLATARLLVALGCRVILTDIDGAAAAAAAQEFAPGLARGLTLDVASEASVTSGFETIAAEEGQLDILVNNAGRAIRRPSLELDIADWDAVVAVNMTGAFLCARAAAGLMVKRGAGGVIVNTASIMGLSGGGLYPNISYQTTKGAIVNMTRALAVEWAGYGIRVNAVAPTWTRTSFIGQLEENPDLMRRIREVTPLGRLAEAEDVAHAIAFLASPAASMITGHTLAVDGGFLAQ